MFRLFFLFVFTYNALAAQETLGIFTYKVLGMPAWDPDSVKSGVTGSEEAVIYMAEQLAKIGYQVFVFGDPPKNSPHALPEANPRYVDVHYHDGTQLDIALAWRMGDSSEWLKTRAKKVYLWPHDTVHRTFTENEIKGFSGVLWLSEWQRQQWLTLNPTFAKFTQIFGNGINPDQFKPVSERASPYACIYGSNYARGLDILLNIWPNIKQKFPHATLDVYYGWQHWGLIPPEKEAQMRAQIKELASKGVQDHGLVGHEELNRAYERASLWTYPCTGLETFCITALRAQLSGALPVILEGSALAETVRFGFKCQKQEDYEKLLLEALSSAEKISLSERKKMRAFILQDYTWEALAKKWSAYFKAN